MVDLYKLNVRQIGDTAFIRPYETLKFGEPVTELKNAVEIAHQKSSRLVLDLSNLVSFDSSTIGEIVSTHQKFGGALGLCGVSEKFMSVLKITKLDTALHIYPTLDKALESTPKINGPQRTDQATASAVTATAHFS
jgi:anti-anti-sigma factor